MKKPRFTPWRRVMMSVNAVARLLSFIVFIVLVITHKYPFETDEPFTPDNVPGIMFFIYIGLNWRLFVLIIFLIPLSVECCCCCGCCGYLGRVVPKGVDDSSRPPCCTLHYLIKTFKLIFWKMLDLPCFRLKKGWAYLIQLAKTLVSLGGVCAGGIIQLSFLKKDEYSKPAVYLYFVTFISVYMVDLFIIIRRFIQASSVPSSLWSVIECDEHFSHKLKKIYLLTKDEFMNRQTTCPRGEDCKYLDVDHRITEHGVRSCPYLKCKEVEKNTKDANLTIGVHQTSIDSIKKILGTHMIIGEKGMIGPGIYFATNVHSTTFKAINQGKSFIVAKLDLGRIKHVRAKVEPEKTWTQSYNSIYYTDAGGDTPYKDEIVLPDDEAILEYSIVITQEAAEEYKSNAFV